jgi:hypothetical protein
VGGVGGGWRAVMSGSWKGDGAVRGMQAGKRRVSEELVGERLAELGQDQEQGQEWLRQLVDEQWWCGACRELRTRSQLEGFAHEGQMIYACLACGELVEALPF